jgi:hypothetical protein
MVQRKTRSSSVFCDEFNRSQLDPEPEPLPEPEPGAKKATAHKCQNRRYSFFLVVLK